jgi:predicted Zn-dependent protease
VLDRGTARQVADLVRYVANPYRATQGRVNVDVGALVRRFNDAPGANDELRIDLAASLLDAGLVAEAREVIEPLLAEPDPDPGAIELAALVAATGGDLPRAAELYDRVLRSTEDEPVALDAARGWYRELIDIHLRRASLASGAVADAALRDALAVARRWRREDGDNPDIDVTCAKALFRMGRKDAAVRELSSIVDRRPAEGGAWGSLGDALEEEGDLAGALLAWDHAAAVEPTNPTWLLKTAQGLFAREGAGDRDRAKDSLEAIAKGHWQDRFSRVVQDADALARASRRGPRQ